jgi:hypothetical protein
MELFIPILINTVEMNVIMLVEKGVQLDWDIPQDV